MGAPAPPRAGRVRELIRSLLRGLACRAALRSHGECSLHSRARSRTACGAEEALRVARSRHVRHGSERMQWPRRWAEGGLASAVPTRIRDTYQKDSTKESPRGVSRIALCDENDERWAEPRKPGSSVTSRIPACSSTGSSLDRSGQSTRALPRPARGRSGHGRTDVVRTSPFGRGRGTGRSVPSS